MTMVIVNKLHRKKVVGQPPTDHLPTTYRPHTDHLFTVHLFTLTNDHSSLMKTVICTGISNVSVKCRPTMSVGS